MESEVDRHTVSRPQTNPIRIVCRVETLAERPFYEPHRVTAGCPRSHEGNMSAATTATAFPHTLVCILCSTTCTSTTRRFCTCTVCIVSTPLVFFRSSRTSRFLPPTLYPILVLDPPMDRYLFSPSIMHTKARPQSLLCALPRAPKYKLHVHCTLPLQITLTHT